MLKEGAAVEFLPAQQQGELQLGALKALVLGYGLKKTYEATLLLKQLELGIA